MSEIKSYILEYGNKFLAVETKESDKLRFYSSNSFRDVYYYDKLLERPIYLIKISENAQINRNGYFVVEKSDCNIIFVNNFYKLIDNPNIIMGVIADSIKSFPVNELVYLYYASGGNKNVNVREIFNKCYPLTEKHKEYYGDEYIDYLAIFTILWVGRIFKNVDKITMTVDMFKMALETSKSKFINDNCYYIENTHYLETFLKIFPSGDEGLDIFNFGVSLGFIKFKHSIFNFKYIVKHYFNPQSKTVATIDYNKQTIVSKLSVDVIEYFLKRKFQFDDKEIDEIKKTAKDNIKINKNILKFLEDDLAI